MKLLLLPTLLSLAIAAIAAAQETKPAPVPAPAPAATPEPTATTPDTKPAVAPAALDAGQVKDRVSYYYGVDVAKSLRENGVDVNLDLLVQGLKDTLDKKDPKYTEKELEQAVSQFALAMQAKQQEQNAASGNKNVEEGKKFLEENAKKQGVTTTESGLQFEVLKKGDGPKPKPEDTVTVHYQGTLLNGKVFDSSITRGEPATFPLNGVIPGWTEGVQLMNVGSKFRFYIPSKLAYADHGAGPDIGPNATLIFEVELLSIGPKP